MFGEKKVKTTEQALETMQWLCSKMERCRSDARRSLYRWGITEKATQEAIIDKLIRDKFIDEQRYAGAFVREKVSQGRWGASKIRYALRAKGIESETIEQAIDENIDTERMDENLEHDLRRKMEAETRKGTTGYDLRAKLFRRAASRGHDFDDINTILDIILKDED